MTGPDILYHYTSWDSVQGILNNQRFWASAYDCMNDPAELISADAMIEEIITMLLRRASGHLAKNLKLFIDTYHDVRMSNYRLPYIISFSRERDDKNQWQMYGGDGNGLCMGVKIPQDLTPMGNLYEVNYCDPAFYERYADAFERVSAMVEKAESEDIISYYFFYGFHMLAFLAGITTKKSSWATEREFRYVYAPNSELKPLERYSMQGRKIRYLPVALSKQGQLIEIAEIIIGASQDVDQSRQRIANILVDAGYTAGSDAITISCSAVGQH